MLRHRLVGSVLVEGFEHDDVTLDRGGVETERELDVALHVLRDEGLLGGDGVALRVAHRLACGLVHEHADHAVQLAGLQVGVLHPVDHDGLRVGHEDAVAVGAIARRRADPGGLHVGLLVHDGAHVDRDAVAANRDVHLDELVALVGANAQLLHRVVAPAQGALAVGGRHELAGVGVQAEPGAGVAVELGLVHGRLLLVSEHAVAVGIDRCIRGVGAHRVLVPVGGGLHLAVGVGHHHVGLAGGLVRHQEGDVGQARGGALPHLHELDVAALGLVLGRVVVAVEHDHLAVGADLEGSLLGIGHEVGVGGGHLADGVGAVLEHVRAGGRLAVLAGGLDDVDHAVHGHLHALVGHGGLGLVHDLEGHAVPARAGQRPGGARLGVELVDGHAAAGGLLLGAGGLGGGVAVLDEAGVALELRTGEARRISNHAHEVHPVGEVVALRRLGLANAHGAEGKRDSVANLEEGISRGFVVVGLAVELECIAPLLNISKAIAVRAHHPCALGRRGGLQLVELGARGRVAVHVLVGVLGQAQLRVARGHEGAAAGVVLAHHDAVGVVQGLVCHLHHGGVVLAGLHGELHVLGGHLVALGRVQLNQAVVAGVELLHLGLAGLVGHEDGLHLAGVNAVERPVAGVLPRGPRPGLGVAQHLVGVVGVGHGGEHGVLVGVAAVVPGDALVGRGLLHLGLALRRLVLDLVDRRAGLPGGNRGVGERGDEEREHHVVVGHFEDAHGAREPPVARLLGALEGVAVHRADVAALGHAAVQGLVVVVHRSGREARPVDAADDRIAGLRGQVVRSVRGAALAVVVGPVEGAVDQVVCISQARGTGGLADGVEHALGGAGPGVHLGVDVADVDAVPQGIRHLELPRHRGRGVVVAGRAVLVGLGPLHGLVRVELGEHALVTVLVVQAAHAGRRDGVGGLGLPPGARADLDAHRDDLGARGRQGQHARLGVPLGGLALDELDGTLAAVQVHREIAERDLVGGLGRGHGDVDRHVERVGRDVLLARHGGHVAGPVVDLNVDAGLLARWVVGDEQLDLQGLLLLPSLRGIPQGLWQVGDARLGVVAHALGHARARVVVGCLPVDDVGGARHLHAAHVGHVVVRGAAGVVDRRGLLELGQVGVREVLLVRLERVEALALGHLVGQKQRLLDHQGEVCLAERLVTAGAEEREQARERLPRLGDEGPVEPLLHDLGDRLIGEASSLVGVGGHGAGPQCRHGQQTEDQRSGHEGR